MYCNSCGSELVDDAAFCRECGARQESGMENEKTDNSVIGKGKREMFDSDIFRFSVVTVIAGIFITLLYLSYLQNLEVKGNQVLVVDISAVLGGEDVSDYTQFCNAIDNGGTIRLNLGDLEYEIESKIQDYGAKDDEGSYFTKGALLNYIAAKGWKFQTANGIEYIYTN